MTHSLDIHASSVSPPTLSAGSPLSAKPKIYDPERSTSNGQDVKSDGQGDRKSIKKLRHAMRRAAGQALPGWRVANCGQKALGDLVTLHHRDEHSHFGGIETCGSIWTCPVCAAKITEGRREEIDALLTAHREAGGRAYMATFTIPHHRFQGCRELRRGVASAWRRVKNGKAWIRARQDHGWLGDIRALEVTHGKNGWHPHLHVLIIFKPGTTKQTSYSFGGWLFDAWANAIDKSGFGQCSRNAFTYDLVKADSGAADYVGKWGVSLELTKAHMKEGRDGGRTPWQILGAVPGTQNSADLKLFQEYAYAFKGARQLTWSHGLKDIYDLTPEVDDEELSVGDQSAESHTATLAKPLFNLIVSKGLTAHVLSAQEAGGLAAVLEVLKRYRIPWHISKVPGLERGRMVPLIALGQSQGPPGRCPERNHSSSGKKEN